MRFRFDRWTVHAPVVSRLKRKEGIEIARLDGAAGRIFMVHPESPTWMRLLVEQAAFHFGNEGGYELIQFLAKERKPQLRGVIFALDERIGGRARCRVVGASTFWWTRPQGEKPFWVMTWIWLHPAARSKGILKSAWPYLHQTFGPFHPQPPYSAAMEHFLRRRLFHGRSIRDPRDRAPQRRDPIPPSFRRHFEFVGIDTPRS